MSMSRQHFQAIADAIKESHTPDETALERQAIDAVAMNVASACKRFNSGFDRARFLAACKVGEKVQ